MNVENFGIIINEFPKLRMIKLQGFGEPFIHNDIFRMIRLLKERGVHVTTTTNATLLDKPMCGRIVSSGLDSLGISLDGASAETYEETRHGADFDRVIENIQNLVKIVKDSNTKMPALTICSVGMIKKIHELPDLVRLTYELGIEKLFYRDCQIKYNVGVEKEQSFYFGTYEDIEKRALVERYFNEARVLAERLGVYLLLPTLKKSAKSCRCTTPWNTTYITWDGNITPCCLIPDFSCGNIYKENFIKIWRNQTYTRFRTNLRKNNTPRQCINCLWNS